MAMSTAEKSRRYHAKKRAEWIALHGEPKKVGGNRKPATFRNCDGCGVCFGPLTHLSQRLCSRACKAEWREPNRAPAKKRTARAGTAQSIVAYHLKTGKLTRPSECEECGRHDIAIEAAHRDYARPLDVRWLCRSCHRRWDKAEPKGAMILARWEQATGQKAKLQARSA